METKNELKFTGSGGTLFSILIVNTLLTIVTLGFYYPWAKVKFLKYYYQNTYFSGSPFSFNGTGNEIFKGFIKAILFLIALYAIAFLCIWIKIPFLAAIIYIAALFLFVPIAIHGSYRYRLAKSSWRSIHFGYRGNFTELAKLCFKGFGLTLLTLGIYGSWFEMNLRRYVYGHIRFGDAQFKSTATGADYFIMNLIGGVLTMITLGIYLPWYLAEYYSYLVDNTEIEHQGNTHKLNLNVSGWEIFKLLFVNALITIFTLGVGYAWAEVRMLKFIMAHIHVPEEFDSDNLVQTEEDYQDASGDSMLDFLDLGFII